MGLTNVEEKESLVYKITVIPTNKYYIGSTCDIYRRLRDHFNYKQSSNVYVANAVAKYGIDNIKVEILIDNLTREEAYNVEQELLDKHFNDSLNMNFSYKAKGNDNELNSLPINQRFNPEEYIGKELNLNFINIKTIRKKFPFIEGKEKETLTTREYRQWYKENRPIKYAIRTPENNIVYIKHFELGAYCKENKITQSKLYSKGYCNNYFMTMDLSKEGIDKLKEATYKINKGNAKEIDVYINKQFSERISNLTKWCKENNLNIVSCRFLLRGKTQKAINGIYTFKYVNEETPVYIKKEKTFNKYNPGNSKTVDIYFNNVFVETINNLCKYCFDNNINYTTAKNIASGRRKKSLEGYTFKYAN